MKKYILFALALSPILLLVSPIGGPFVINAQITSTPLNPTNPTATVSYIVNLNNQISKLAPNYSNRITAVALRTLLRDRKNEMLNLAKISPRQFLNQRLSPTIIQRIPSELRINIEQPVSLTGRLEVMHVDDFENPENSRYDYSLVVDRDKHTLYTTKDLSLRSGTILSVNGYQIENSIVVDSEISANAQVTATAPPIEATGDQRVVVLMVNFRNKQARLKSSFEQIADSIYGRDLFSVRDYYSENSYGKTNFIGSIDDIYGYFTLPIDATSDFANADWLSLIIPQVDNQVIFSDYNRILIYIPINPDLLGLSGIRGMSSIGKQMIQTNDGLISASVSYVFNNQEYFDTYVSKHELGHGLGAYHNGVYECGNKIIDSLNFCLLLYNSSLLNNLGSTHLTAYTKEQLGWLDLKNILTLSPNGPFGRYRIYPIELSSGDNLKAIKIPMSSEFNPWPFLPNAYYYLEFKRAIGLDDITTQIRPFTDPVPRTYHFADYYNGVLMSVAERETFELDNSPHLMTGTPYAFSFDDIEDNLDIVLKQGSTFVDRNNGIAVTVIDVNQNYLEIDIDMKQPVSLTVTAPNGGEYWPYGQPQRITWSSGNLPVDYQIVAYLVSTLTGVKHGLTAADLNYSNDGFQPINASVLNTVATGDYRLEIETARWDGNKYVYGEFKDQSDGTIRVGNPAVSPTITFSLPIAGQLWYGSTTQTVAWTTRDVALAGQAMFLSLKPVDPTVPMNALFLAPIISHTAPSGSASTTVPAGTIPGDYFFELTTFTPDSDGKIIWITDRSAVFEVGPTVLTAVPITPLVISGTGGGTGTTRDRDKDGSGDGGGTGAVPTPTPIPSPVPAPISLLSSNPPTNAIDARENLPITATGAGWKSLDLNFSGPAAGLTYDSFSVAGSNPAGAPKARSVQVNAQDSTRATLTLTRPIQPGERLTITHKPSGTSVCLGFLPGDVNQDGRFNATDLSVLRSWASTTVGSTKPLYQTDINRDGVFDTTDPTRLSELRADPNAVLSLPVCPQPLALARPSGGGQAGAQGQVANIFSTLREALEIWSQLLTR